MLYICIRRSIKSEKEQAIYSKLKAAHWNLFHLSFVLRVVARHVATQPYNTFQPPLKIGVAIDNVLIKRMWEKIRALRQ